MFKKLKSSKGFTIIEVLIVLAIAGLIMVIVFLAVPALQRNARNNGRDSDARLVASAVHECLTNRNGVAASCQSTANVIIDLTKMNQLTTAPAYGAGTGSISQATWGFNAQCTADGTGTTLVTSARSFAVRWQDESNTGTPVQRCISG